MVNLLKLFADSECDVGIRLSAGLTRSVEASTEANISKYRVSLNSISSLDLLLIHDPTYYNLTRAMAVTKTRSIKALVAASTPFLADNNIQRFQEQHKSLTSLGNNLAFLNPHGYTEVYSNATVDDIRREVNRILSSKQLMWRHWPGLLILLDGCELIDKAMTALRPLIRHEYVKILPFDEVNDVKGLQFQHVVVFIKQRPVRGNTNWLQRYWTAHL